MKKLSFVLVSLAVLALFALIGMPNTGCSTIQQILQPTTAPSTQPISVATVQAELDDAWRIANDAHKLGLLTDQQWTLIQNAYPVAQAAINLALSTASDNQASALDFLDAAAKAVSDFRTRANTTTLAPNVIAAKGTP